MAQPDLGCTPELVWGLLARGIALVFLIAFASLIRQIVPLAGRAGVAPVGELMTAIERDFSWWRRLVYFPSLLWFNRSDGMLRGLVWVGVAAACWALYGGAHSPWAFALCYVVYLSLDRAVVLVYPWDSLLLEAGFWALFLPPLAALPELDSSVAPLPALAWVYRLLMFRLMFGFGKQKFLGSGANDAGFLKGFFIRQPLPTPLGWLAHHLPMPVHKLSLFLMFMIEVPLSIGWLIPGAWSVVAASSTVALMLAIAASGNYGYFNVLTIALCAVGFDNTTPAALELQSLFAPENPARAALHGLIALHTAGALLTLPGNTWCSFTWTLWPFWLRVRPRFLTWPITFVRLLQPLRWLHAYGVFAPRAAPAVRLAPVIEVSWDEEHWQELRHPYSPTTETSAPVFCAPHHPRLDQALVYESIGFDETGALRGLCGRWDPYGHGKASGAKRLLYRVLQGRADPAWFAGSLPTERPPPSAVRARLYMLEPTSLRELSQTGRWWRRSLIGPHFPAIRLRDAQREDPLPPPELWHFEDWIWVRRSRLGRSLSLARAGADPHALALAATTELRDRDVDALWQTFLPAYAREGGWDQLHEQVASMRAQYDAEQLLRFERLIGRYTALLIARLEPLFHEGGLRALLGSRAAALPVQSHHQLGLLAHVLIAQGRSAYDRVYTSPELAIPACETLTIESAGQLIGLFRYDALLHHSAKVRLLESQVAYRNRAEVGAAQAGAARWARRVIDRLWGVLEWMSFLRPRFIDALDVPERWPRFELGSHGEIRRVPSTDPQNHRSGQSTPAAK